jgi:Fur family transcriptional regulator, peroxide stress response regulator
LASTRELFKRHNLRCTRQRLALFEALRNCMTHPTAEELYRMVQSKAGGLSRATVYNTLDSLCQAGLARRMATTNGCCRYDADTSEHLHFRCRETSEIHDVPSALSQQLIQKLPRQVLHDIEKCMGVQIEGVSIQLLGTKREAAHA